MDLKLFLRVFGSVFVAELGDKTQLATLLFAAGSPTGKVTVFLGASAALVATSALGVLGGTLLGRFIDERKLGIAAGVLFIGIGAWTLFQALKTPTH